ncbi:MAG: DUF2207 domain-containing protein [Leadbetterella sp.]|nr:DUF2207 domain-containing protein [Leadbetterella sp.]
MKRTFLLLLLTLTGFSGFAQDLSIERILLYDVELQADTSARLTVTEKLKVNVKGQHIQRGIYRSLPQRRFINNRDIAIRYDVRSVKKNGRKEKYSTKRENGSFVIYIGDKDVLLEPGVYDYEIIYDTYRQIGFFEDFDELYWNATGTNWVFPIDKVIVKAILPEKAAILQNACYTGAEGSKDQECRGVKTTDHVLEWTAEGLQPQQGLTVAAGFSKGVIKEPELPAMLRPANLSKILSGIGVLFLLWMVYLWNRYGRDHPKPTVYPQFEVPDNLSPASLGFLHGGRYRNNMIAASLINLAVKGYIIIHEPAKKGLFSRSKFTLEKQKASDQSLPPEEATLMRELFSDSQDKVTIDGEYSPRIARAVQAYQQSLHRENYPKLRKGSNWLKVLWVFLGVSLVYWAVLGFSHRHLYEPGKLIMGIILYAGAVVTLGVILAVRLQVARYIWLIPLLFAAGAVAFWHFLLGKAPDSFIIPYLFLLLSMVALAVFNYFVRQPSEELQTRQSLIEGFKMYLEAAETELLKFHNPPQITPELFEKYLPYALVLGVDGIWGRKFEQSIRTHAYEYENRWYTGSSAAYFSSGMTHSLSRSLSGTMSSSSVSPSSSGSGGGGSSGGGGGGGGGGGW